MEQHTGSSKSSPALYANWGWSWVERWIAVRPWESRLPDQSITPKKPRNRQINKAGKNSNSPKPKPHLSNEKETKKKKPRRLSYPGAEKPAARQQSIETAEVGEVLGLLSFAPRLPPALNSPANPYPKRESNPICKSMKLGGRLRDLKPENLIFVNKDDISSLKAIDFGHSVFFKSGQVFNETRGSLPYIAPEMLLSKDYGPEVDICSAGVILFILLSGGKLPFNAETAEGIIDLVLKGQMDFESEHWSERSEYAKDLVRKMLRTRPSERLTANEVLSHPWICRNINPRISLLRPINVSGSEAMLGLKRKRRHWSLDTWQISRTEEASR
ncbi:hypothetical protein V6N13_143698 [Hibiscus sabdariffa]